MLVLLVLLPPAAPPTFGSSSLFFVFGPLIRSLETKERGRWGGSEAFHLLLLFFLVFLVLGCVFWLRFVWTLVSWALPETSAAGGDALVSRATSGG